jgi:hypothetical protein
MAQFASHIYMDEISRTSSPDPPSMDARRWIGRVVLAVILAEGIWGIVVSVTNNLILPLLARTMGSDVQSPLYLGKGDLNIPALFTSVLNLCFAGIVAVILNFWVQRKPRVASGKSVRVSPVRVQPVASTPSSPAVATIQAAPKAASAPAAPSMPASSPSPGQYWSPPPEAAKPKAAAVPPPPAKPAKPKSPKEIYYNIVGEPINPTEDE